MHWLKSVSKQMRRRMRMNRRAICKRQRRMLLEALEARTLLAGVSSDDRHLTTTILETASAMPVAASDDLGQRAAPVLPLNYSDPISSGTSVSTPRANERGEGEGGDGYCVWYYGVGPNGEDVCEWVGGASDSTG